MRRGHCYGTRKVTRKQQAWFDARQEELLRQIEAQWAAKAATKQQADTK
jgi:hypothetical protein